MSEALTPEEVLRTYWGYHAFRPKQREIIQSVLDGYDTLALLPTGGGKSLTFQVPALMREGVCIVITPLVALMKDQVDTLRGLGIRAAYLHSGQRRQEAQTVMDNCVYGAYKLLYVSPERLQSRAFLDRLSALDISFIVVDESHCISQWGYDFRPSYLSIAEFRALVPEKSILALTATATPMVAEDIRKSLSFREGHRTISRSFYRKGLSYVVRKTEDKPRELIHILRSVQGSALVYVRSRKKTADIAKLLSEQGFSADFYHAGLAAPDKAKKQNAWQQGQIRVMVCTNAFGMGIDKDDVRLVIHPDLPSSLESYYQEAGRAGRDNQQSYAVLLYTPGMDEGIAKKRISASFPPKETVRRVYDALGDFFEIAIGSAEGCLFELPMYRFCRSTGLSRQEVRASLNLLTVCGYLTFEEDRSYSSRLMFRVTRNELYSIFDSSQSLYDDIVEQILREYTGIFTDYAFIDEALLAHKLDLRREVLYECLLQMSRWRVIDYVPGRRSSFVRYEQIRLSKERIRIPREVYEERYQAEVDRLEAVFDYIDTDRCRAEVLLKYFGEQTDRSCGWCDCCLSHSSQHRRLTFRKIDRILHFLDAALTEQSTLPIKEVAAALDLPRSEIEEALTFLRAEGHPYRLSSDALLIKD